MQEARTESCIPNPEYLIKSIAEQGYTLETSIADLIDNSVSAEANKTEILVDTQAAPFCLFIADDGWGMTEEELRANMAFPSSSPEKIRQRKDLGRFGLGLKTASFAQTRCFTVISRKKGSVKFHARTWDVQLLVKGNWEVIINSEEEIKALLERYDALSAGFLNPLEEFIPNTIVIWHGLYKFETEVDRQRNSDTLKEELTGTIKEHLQLIFHRFMEKPVPLQIRLNNSRLAPFNPFPVKARRIQTHLKGVMGNALKLEGFVLPNNSIEESKELSEWTLPGKSLIDMEGLYIYRADRLIVFGGWHGLVKSRSRLQLARLKVEIDNGIDHLFHLNVAKSSINIPFGERIGFRKYIVALMQEAKKEYYNHIRPGKALEAPGKSLFRRIPTNQGIMLTPDKDFPLLEEFTQSLSSQQQKQFRIIVRMFTTRINQIRQVHVDESFVSASEKDEIAEHDMANIIHSCLKNGFTKKHILNDIIPAMGIDTASLPTQILLLLK